MQPLLITQNLMKYYPGTTALNKITFTLPKNTILGLLGPNGSGKSTFMRIAAGLTRPSAGKILIKGMEPGVQTKGLISYMPDYDHIYNWMTVKESVNLFSLFFPSFQKERTAEMLDFMKLPLHKNTRTLSHGLKARLKLVLAFSWDAELVLLDEPLSGIDPASREKIVEGVLMNYSNERKGIIISTHLVNEVEPLLNRVIFLRSGEIVFDGDADEVREKHGYSLDQIIRRELV